jgi:hypothetical protein
MSESDGEEAEVRPAPAPGEAESGSLRDRVREIVHGLNGALNNLILNIELLDRLEEDGHDEVRRARYLAGLRRATREIQEIAEKQILPLGRGERPRT